MLRRTSLLLVAVALALPLGCGKKQQLTEVEVPDAGVTLRYDVSPGQEYAGHVKMRNSLQTPMGDVTTNIEFDVALAVSANKVGDAMLVRATVQNIVLNLRLPDGIPAAAAGGMTPEAAAALNGMELRFHLTERGKVDEMPEPPESAPMPVKGIINMIAGGLTAGLGVKLPEQPVKNGESWDSKPSDPDKNVTSATSTGTFQGMGRNEAGEDIVQLAYTGEVQSERTQGGQTMKVIQKAETEVSFSASGGYPAQVKRKLNNEVVGQGTILTEVEAEWTKGAKQDVGPVQGAPAEGSGGEQDIADPCDPDYVGMGECVEDGAPPADAPPPSTAPEEAAPAEAAPPAEAKK